MSPLAKTRAHHPALPLTIIGGYLGAGKTTLVNHLLRHAEGLRLAVLVNEFGALPIDGDLIESQSGNVISIAGGCVCCSYGNDLIFALEDLARMDPPVAHVLLEASGVGIPGAIAATVGLLESYALDGVVVVADAETVRATAADRYMGDTVSAQLQQADIVIVNKADLVEPEDLRNVRDWLATAASRACLVTATRAALPPSVVLESFLGRKRPQSAAPQLQAKDFRAKDFHASIIDVTGATDPDSLAHALIEEGFIRAKGFVRTGNGMMKTIQVIGKRYEITAAPDGVTPGVVGIRPQP